MRRAALLPLLLALALLGSCGDDEQSGPSTVERTRVQVVEGLGGKNGFDPTTIYERLSPGVVTITSLFSKSDSLSDILEGGGAGQGSGFVLDGEGYIATNAHVITNGTGSKLKQAKEVFVQFQDGNQVSADVVGYDANADVGVIKVYPKGLKLVPIALGRTADVRVGEPVAAIGSPFGEQGSLSIGVVSAKNRTIEALTDFSISRRDPDRRRRQPGQLRRTAARRARPVDRDQLADPVVGRGKRRRRVRDLGRQRPALDRADPRRRRGELRVHRDQLAEPLSPARRAARRTGRRGRPDRGCRERRSGRPRRDQGRRKGDPLPGDAREARGRRDHEGERHAG